jgi:hypothetical protein
LDHTQVTALAEYWHPTGDARADADEAAVFTDALPDQPGPADLGAHRAID